MRGKPGDTRVAYYATQTVAQLSGKLDGLTEEQAENRRLTYGGNVIQGIRKDTLTVRLRRAFLNPFSAVLIVLAIISVLVDVVFADRADRNYTTFCIILTMLLISGCVRLSQELNSKKITDQLLNLVDTTIQVRRNGQWVRLDASELVVDDVIRLTAGERVPADIRLTRVHDCFLSESVITGESEMEEKTTDTLFCVPEKIRDYKNIAFCGTTVTNGSLEGIIVAVGNQTLYGELEPEVSQRKQGYDRGSNSIAWVLIRFMALLVPIVFIASGLAQGNWISSFLFALSVAVGLTPELLPMVNTACLARGSYNMKQRQTIVKNVNAMQGFGSMDVLCIDKTGTLTEDTLLLEYYMDILGNEEQQVLDAAYLNSFFHAGVYNQLDTSIIKVNQMPGKGPHYSDLIQRYKKLDECPFDYTRKFSSVLVTDETGNLLLVKGNIDAVLQHCSHVYYKGRILGIHDEAYASVHAVVDEMLKDGMKVLAVAVKKTECDELTADDEQNLILMGYLGFFDAPKETAAHALQKLNDLRVGTKVLTGDNLDVAISVCRRLGMDTSEVMTGRDFDVLTDNEIQIRVEKTSIFAELSSVQKAKIVEILQSNGHTVGFLADGMNDLPAVFQSDVGISVDTAVPSVKECADVILLKKDLNVLQAGIAEGRRAFANMSKYVRITASSNLGNIIAIVFASIFLPFFPMTSIQILLLNLLYDILCLVLPWDRVDSETVQKPMEWSGKSLSTFMMVFGPVSSVFDLVTFFFLFCILCPTICGGTYEALSLAGQATFVSVFQTGWFLESMWTQVLILHLLRTGRIPFLQSRPSLPVVIVTVAGIIVCTLLVATPVGSLMGMTSLPPVYFAFLVIVVLCYLLVITGVKHVYMHRHSGLI